MKISPSLYATARQFFVFGMVGMVGFVVDYAMFHVGIDLIGLPHIPAALFSFPFAVSVTWVGNRRFTFRNAAPMSAHKQLSKFAAVCAVGLIFNRGTMGMLDTFIPLVHTYPILGLLGGTAAGMFFNFFAARKHVFGA